MPIKITEKQNITKLDKAKEGIILPLFCPTCARTLKPHLDKRWYVMYGHCFDCQVMAEHKLRQENKLEQVEKEVTNDYIEGLSKDFEIWFEDFINTKESFITEQGDVEKCDGSGKEQLLRQKQEVIEYLKLLKK